MNSARLKNNTPDPMALPAPFSGILQPGEVINARFSPKRARYLIDNDHGINSQVRQVTIEQGPPGPLEESVSAHTPPRDYFSGYCRTSGAVTSSVVWRLPEGDGPLLTAAQFQLGAYEIDLKVIGAREGAAGFSVFRRLLRFQVVGAGIDSGTAVTQTLGTDTETDAGTALAVVFSASGIDVQPTGIALKNYRWSASADVTMCLGTDAVLPAP